MEVVYIVAGLVVIMMVALILKDKFNPDKDVKKSEEECAKEIVDRMIVTERKEDSTEDDDEKENND